MTSNDLQLAVAAAELAARLLPGVIQIGANIIDAIQGCDDMSDADKAALVARVTKTAGLVAAYEPRPIPDPPPTAPGR